MLIELMEMEAEGGGWIPNELFKDDPNAALQQASDLRVLIGLVKAMEPA